MNKKILNNKEEKEIASDVKDALFKAKQKSKNIVDRKMDDVVLLDQEEIDNGGYKKSTNGKKTLIVSFVVILFVFAFGLYFYLVNNPRTIFAGAVEKSFKAYENSFNSSLSNIVSGTITTDNDKIAYSLNNYDGIYKTTGDSSVYLNKGNIYYKVNGVYYKINNYALPFTPNSEKEVKILKGVSRAFLKSILYQKIISNKLDIVIDGKNHKTYRSSLVINKKNSDEIFGNILKFLKENREFVNTYGEITELDEKDVLLNISMVMDFLKQKVNSFENVTISFYTEGANQNVLKFEIILGNSVYSITKLDDNNYKYEINDKYGKINAGDVISITGDYKVTLSKQNTNTFNKEFLKDDLYSLDEDDKYNVIIGLLPVYLTLNS